MLEERTTVTMIDGSINVPLLMACHSNNCTIHNNLLIFTARCTLVQSAVLRSHVVCLSVRPSVRPSVTLMNCDHIGWNSSKIISHSVSLGCSLFATQTSRVYSKGNTLEFSPEYRWGAEKVAFGVQML